jgi:crotonobetainyl-CoA:carnitine CoA-transferase CaiB-like acyl-CoA transferase
VGLLDDVTVLDLTRVLAGPYCTRLLADLGARIIKIERPGEGDEMRRGYLQLEDGRTDQSTYFVRINAGKLSLALDLAHPEAKPVVQDLARRADVVVENFRPGVVARLGCDYATLAAIKPDLVYCSISGFGQTGPHRERPAFAHIISTESGLMDLERQGEAAPRVAYLQASDVLAGTHAFGAIVAALLRRERTGEGAYLDVAMLECLIAAEDVSYAALLNGGDPYLAPRPGMIVHRVGEAWVGLQSVGAPELWPRLLRAMARPDLATDPRFSTPAARRSNWAALHEIITAWLEGFAGADDAVEALTAARLPCARMLTPSEVVAHPHLAARGFFPDVPHPTRGKVRVTATPFHVDGRPLAPAGPAPYRVGEHTQTVLGEFLGYPASKIASLLAQGVIGRPEGTGSAASL